MTTDHPITKGQPGIARAALFAECPACGARTLFAGLIRFAPRCRACGLDFGAFNVGDGPAAFLTMGVGGLVIALAALLEQGAHPPFWIHALLWPLVTIGLVLAGLRFTKAALLIAEYRRDAREGRLAERERP